MNSLDLIMLGRKLMKIGEEAVRGSGAPGLPMGPSAVLRDVFANPNSSITDITIRTGLPQGYVSECIAKLRDDGVIETDVDPVDRRRTLSRISTEHRRTVAAKFTISVDAALAEALGEPGADAASKMIETLSMVAMRLRPEEPGVIIRQITTAD